MAVGLETLEKFNFFSKKKREVLRSLSTAQERPSTPAPWMSKSETISQTFPTPSFIRPTSSRMMAREEFVFTSRSPRRAHSLPDSPETPGMSLVSSENTAIGSTESSPRSESPSIPQRASSLGPSRSRSVSLAELLDFSFDTATRVETDANSSPARRSRSDSRTMPRSTSSSISPRAINRRRRSPVSQTRRTTPQLLEDTCLSLSNYCQDLPPTPPLSPVTAIMPESPLGDEDEALEPLSQRRQSLHISNETPSEQRPRRSISFTTFSVTRPQSNDSLNLTEPSLSDFMALSDDDIADDSPIPPPLSNSRGRDSATTSKPPGYGLPPDPPVLVNPPSASTTYPLLTLPPPLASRPAAAAAFEAARIAAKYNFDLVYVVNLWPTHVGFSPMVASPVPGGVSSHLPPSPPLSPTTVTSHPHGGMTGRLLAAYGLSSLTSPFRISAPVHQKVLRTEGWLEYRSEDAAADEYARGYSCSFYTGYSPDRRAAESTQATNKDPNRGIVFAAYRLPQPSTGNETPLESSSATLLETLHQDAETLVDLLMDIHMTQRWRRLPSAAAIAAPKRGPDTARETRARVSACP
ncbi:hypothetical protein QBC35DRAFT_75017 [Podospora australis]|uniref:Uncharacterized protein n=1 Tax=Podospora australis TaxID=1536484 RepID=A0AAN6WZ03_9PEZI|nr:hypothetical protein QBC35DRAFT_75017 [Podospora australis]